MNKRNQLAFSARADWAIAVLLSKVPGAETLAENRFKAARDSAWAYGWGASEEPSPMFADVPELIDAFHAGSKTLHLDCCC